MRPLFFRSWFYRLVLPRCQSHLSRNKVKIRWTKESLIGSRVEMQGSRIAKSKVHSYPIVQRVVCSSHREETSRKTSPELLNLHTGTSAT